jgi:hypothetical protein
VFVLDEVDNFIEELVVCVEELVVCNEELVVCIEELADVVFEVEVGAAEDTVPKAAGKRFPIGHPAFAHGLLIQHP